MSFIRRSIIAGAGALALHLYRKKRAEMKSQPVADKKVEAKVQNNGAVVSETTIPDVRVDVEPTNITTH